MKYLETKHERNSAKITTLIVLILLLLFFVVGAPYMDPSEEYGVAVNFGNSPVGSGNIQPNKPVKSEDLNINKPPQETTAKPTETQENPTEDVTAEQNTSQEEKQDLLTQETEEAIAIKKAEAEKKAKAQAEAKQKAEAERIAKQKAAAAEKKRQEEAKKKAELDAMMGGIANNNGETSGSEGNDNQAGDKGQLNGNPYAPSYFGDSGTGNGGVGSGLNGRGRGKFTQIKQKCNESGLVVVRIEVDRNGNVVKAEPGVKGTENTAPCLLEPAKKIALSGKWPADSKAPTRQIGFVSIDFKLGQ